MSTETVMDMSLDTRTSLPDDFTFSCQILILSQHLIELPAWFLCGNRYVKVLDMSKCTKITIIPNVFCTENSVEHIIWPPDITVIHDNCLCNSNIQKIDLSYCNQLIKICNNFCENTNITDIILPVSIQNISDGFCGYSTLTHLDLSHCVNLIYIGSYFCEYTNIKCIKFPKSLMFICHSIYNQNVQELDFSDCKDIIITTYGMCKMKTLKIYSIDNIAKMYIHCENIYIYNITETKSLDLTDIKSLRNVHLPEGKYCIANIQSKDYSNINFWLGHVVFPASYFIDISLHKHSYLNVKDLDMLDTQLETI
jgi:hypothetical protein